jgi:hypothetical protein
LGDSVEARETEVREREAHPAPVVEVVSSLDTRPAADVQALEKRETRVLNILLNEWHSQALDEIGDHLHLDWLFFTTTYGTNANCTDTSISANDNYLGRWDSGMDGLAIDQLYECPTGGEYRLEDLYDDKKFRKQACLYKCDGRKGGAGAIWCGSTFISQCEQEKAKIDWPSLVAEHDRDHPNEPLHLPETCGTDDRRMAYIV